MIKVIEELDDENVDYFKKKLLVNVEINNLTVSNSTSVFFEGIQHKHEICQNF